MAAFEGPAAVLAVTVATILFAVASAAAVNAFHGEGVAVHRGRPLGPVAVVATLLAGAAPAQAQAQAQTLAALPSGTRLAGTGPATPTPAWFDFCRRLPAECTIDEAEPTAIALTPEVWALLGAVNRDVNERIGPMTDQEHWGVVDHWDYPDDGFGDCEDFQLLKRKLLAERGLPRRAMRMTVVLDEKGNGHAVLMVRTDRGDFILDNRRTVVLPWRETVYVFVKREGQASRGWVSLEANPAAVATATSEGD